MRRFLPLFFLVLLSVTAAQAQGVPTDTAHAAIARMSAAYQALAETVNRAVVQVHAQRYDAPTHLQSRSAEGTPRPRTGSGVFVDAAGYVVTNAHVVDGAREVHVRLAPAPQGPPGQASILRPRGDLLGAEVVGIDRETDVAVLKVAESDHPALPFGDSDFVRPGQVAFAFGSPLGLENSVSMGVVSATARQLREDDPMIYIQTDAPINPGSSGGPLVNARGEIVGINTFILTQSGGSEGLGFAAPSNIVEAVYRQIRQYGRVRRGVIGVHAQTLTSELARALEIDGMYGVILGDVYPGSPADRAGLQPGDVVTRLNGKFMENGRQLDVNLYGALGEIATLDVLRDGRTFEAKVRVVQRQDDRARFAELASPEDNLIERLGILGLSLRPEIAALLPQLRFGEGVVVASSSGHSAAWGDALEPGDIIYVLDNQRVTTVEQLRSIVELLPAGATVAAHLQRHGRLQYLTLQVE